MTIAVIDSGVHSSTPTAGGVNLTGAGARGDAADEHGHGTAVASTILRHAPGARIIPIRVTDGDGVLVSPELLDEAFDWVLDRWDGLGIGVISAAFGDMSHCRSDQEWRGSRLQVAIATLRTLGVATVASAGNWHKLYRSSQPQGMAWPAILRETVSVGELAGGRLSSNTQRLHRSWGTGCATTVFAEAEPPGNTSGAAAVVTGQLAELRRATPSASVDELVGRLLAAGRTVEEDGLEWPALPYLRTK
jgi:subtilisin family serine protease